MNASRKKAIEWIEAQDTKFCRVLQEKAKYLVATTLANEMPHQKIWWEVCKAARGMK